MRRSTFILVTALLSSMLVAGSAASGPADPRGPQTTGCKSAARDDPAERVAGGGYRYRLEVVLKDQTIRPVAGSCSTTAGGDQVGLIVSAPTDHGWECVYGSPGDSAGAIRIRATVVGCAGIQPE